MTSIIVEYTASTGEKKTEEISLNETMLDLSDCDIISFDISQLSELKELHYLNLSNIPLSNNTSLIPLSLLKNLESLYITLESNSLIDISPLFFIPKLRHLVMNQVSWLNVYWMLKYYSPKPKWFENYESAYKWNLESNIEDQIPLHAITDFIDSMLKLVQDDKIDETKEIDIICELAHFLINNQRIRELYDPNNLKSQTEISRKIKRKKLASRFQVTEKSMGKLFCILLNFVKKKLRSFKLLKDRIPLHSIKNCAELTEQQKYRVSSFLEKRQNIEESRKLNVWFSSILTIFLAINISLVLYFRIDQPSLLNTLLANLAIPSAIVSLILPLMHSYSNYHNRIDFKVATGKIAYLYITNILAVGTSFLLYLGIADAFNVLRSYWDPSIIDLSSLSLQLIFVIGWAKVAYVYVESKDIGWLKSVYKPSNMNNSHSYKEKKCELNEIETFIQVGSTYTQLSTLFWIFTFINTAFVWTTVEGMYVFQFSEIFWFIIPLLSIISFLIPIILIWNFIWMIINGRVYQSKLIEHYLAQNDEA